MSEQPIPESPPHLVPGRLKVIYVMGAGRSGSTILGVTLGNCEGIFHAGELDKWLVKRGAPELADSTRTQFWSAIRDEVDPAGLFGYDAHRFIERSVSLFRVRDWPSRRRLRGRYRRVSEDLYYAIARATAATHLVDTSHYPLRARELQALCGVDLHLLFLVRDPQSVIASLDRRDVVERRFGALAANAYLWLTHLVSIFIFLRHPRDRRLFVRHEDFIDDPAGVLRQILERAGSAAPIPDLTSLRTGIPLHGNRLLKAQVIAIDREAALPRHRSLITTLLQFPWRPVFSRLRPAVTVSASPNDPPAPISG